MTDPIHSQPPGQSKDPVNLQRELLLTQLPTVDRTDMKALLDAVQALPEEHRDGVEPAAGTVLGNYVQRVRELSQLTERLAAQAIAQEALLDRLAQRPQADQRSS